MPISLGTAKASPGRISYGSYNLLEHPIGGVEQLPVIIAQGNPRGPTFWQTVASVLASFFGVQSSKNRQRDFKHGKAAHFIVIGLIATAALVLTIVLVVKIVLKQAGV